MLISVYKLTRVESNLGLVRLNQTIKHNITWCQEWAIFQPGDERYTRARRAQL